MNPKAKAMVCDTIKAEPFQYSPAGYTYVQITEDTSGEPRHVRLTAAEAQALSDWLLKVLS